MTRVFWLYYGRHPIYAVVAPADASADAVKARALAQLDICPCVYADYPSVAPFEFAAMVRAATVTD